MATAATTYQHQSAACVTDKCKKSKNISFDIYCLMGPIKRLYEVEQKTHIGYSHPMGPQELANPAAKIQIHTSSPIEALEGSCPSNFTNSYLRVMPTTM